MRSAGSSLIRVKVFVESEVVSSVREATPDGGLGVRCHVRPVEVPLRTVKHLVLAELIE